ncbi:MAG TPA: MGMT family protein [Ignavibacteriaceae bacterium]|nr:MGMT family protein [Ignavibacteriaceae bacterium]
MGKKKTDFFDKVYKVVEKIPYGKVTTYGHIAEACGIRSAARTVGWAINGTSSNGLPCHRVVNRYGALTGRLHFGDPDLMEDLLRSEGIEFNKEGCVILEKHLWIPQPLHLIRKKVKKK